MVLHKRLDYGFNGYQVPPIPRATRSARGRGNIRKKSDGNEMCAFDLLTTVAGKLLLEGESTPNSTNTVKEEEDTSLKENLYNEGIRERGFFISPIVSEAPVVNHCLSKSKDTLSGQASVITSSDCSEKLDSAERFINCESKNETGNCSTKVEQEASGFGDFSNCTLGAESKKQMKIDLSNDAKIFSSQFPDLWDRKPTNLVASDNTVKLSLSTDPVPFGSFPVIRNDVKLTNKDDDENSCGCAQPSTRNKAFRPTPRVGNFRTRKLIDLNPKFEDADSETRHVYNRKNDYKSERSQRDFPFKKRKLYYCNSFSDSDGGSSDRICSSPTKDINRDAAGYSLASSGARAAVGTSISRGARTSSDSHVKLKIKSFRVPELFVEIPENATVGSLKRTVMEAVTAILGGGLHIGVVFQGKKVRDDNKTLLQAGISHDDKLDALGFTLEPNPSRASSTSGPESRSRVLPCDTLQPLTRGPPTPTVICNGIRRGTYSAFSDHPEPNLNNFIESDHDSAPSPPDASLEKDAADSRALVPVAAVNAEALAVVPMRKHKRSETAQRRIRRPFSVYEVEALVQAVEKLGTGRWRDVKMRAFDNAKHRTYVDLKDKWKTLVHTARISPQQRRGEPVPQELLDRVLIAHGYWSQKQAKQHMKHQSETRLLL
ncbi:PREDICTED: telomere repeat-binding protein 5-like [Nicotiana attenuata]|uniref:Telomere repeat-binding protein 5 n=1 Tax=Nicotiana attenuata TaxID=49451 RepID=A0A1J6JID7_NICAT|nr:PREDICTED: telomere repeat-binding protein 5-like [Nicotiana attenuata]OIT06729.1 telomere repeat-binding protein 5 [Nicotiana attenuata]